jgi:hypothetical protein
MRQFTWQRLAVAALIGLGAAACGSSGSTGPSGGGGGGGGGGSITTAQAQGAASAAQGIGQSGLNVFTSEGSDLGVSGLPSLAAQATGAPAAAADVRTAIAAALYSAGIRGKVLGALGVPPVFRSSATCSPTISGSVDSVGNYLDSDGDGIPDSVVAVYTVDNCVVTDTATGSTFSFVGTFTLVDVNGLFGFRLDVDLKSNYVTPSQNSLLYMKGSELLTITDTTAALNINLTTDDSLTAGGHLTTTQVLNQTDFKFVVAQGQTIVLGSPWPDGTMAITGHVGTTIPNQPGSFAFDLTTPTLMAFSSACANVDNNPPFTAGKIVGVFTGYASASFSVTFTGCGQSPTVVVNGTSA